MQNSDVLDKLSAKCTPELASAMRVTHQELVEVEIHQKISEIVDRLRGSEDATEFLIRTGSDSAQEAGEGGSAYRKAINDVIS